MSSQRLKKFGPYSPNTGIKPVKTGDAHLVAYIPYAGPGVRAQFRSDLLDGPDEVHLRTVARHERDLTREVRGSTAAYFTLPKQLQTEPRIR